MAPSPSSGHSTLSGRLRATPITTWLEAANEALARAAVLFGARFATSVMSAGAALSGSTSAGEMRFFLEAFLVEDRFERAATVRARFLVDDASDAARWDVHSAFADALDLLPVM